MGPRAFAARGASPRPPRCWASIDGAANNNAAATIANVLCFMSIHHLTRNPSPRLAIGRPRDFDQARSRAVRAARWVCDHLDGVSNFENVLVDALLRKLGRCRALDGPSFHVAFGIRNFDVKERMGRAER